MTGIQDTTMMGIGARITGIAAGRERAPGMTTIEEITVGETETETSIEVERTTEKETTADPHYRTPALHPHPHLPTLRRILSINLLPHPFLLAPLLLTWRR